MQGWLNGRHFPTPVLRPNYQKLIDHVGLTAVVPEGLWDDGWITLHRAPRGIRCPYPGERPFTTADHPYFFGRTAQVERLAQSVLAQRARRAHGIVLLLGASGSGTSSQVAAGLLAGQCVSGMLAGTHGILRAPSTLSPRDVDADLVVVDQAEDLFTEGGALEALSVVAARTTVVLGMRADAADRAAEQPLLQAAVEQHTATSPLTSGEVHDLIVEPARLEGVSVEDDLVSTLVNEVAPGTSDTVSTAVLPLLACALRRTWLVGSGQAMRLADYQSTGGIAHVIDTLAEEAFEGLAPGEQQQATSLFLRLITIVGNRPLRLPQPLATVPMALMPLARTFIQARILRVTRAGLSISHELVLAHWERLGGWIAESRAELTAFLALRHAAELWQQSGRDSDVLLPVNRLGVFGVLADPARRTLLNPVESQYLRASEARFGPMGWSDLLSQTPCA